MGKKISEDYFQATHCFAIVFLSFLRQQTHLNFRATTKKHRDEQNEQQNKTLVFRLYSTEMVSFYLIQNYRRNNQLILNRFANRFGHRQNARFRKEMLQNQKWVLWTARFGRKSNELFLWKKKQ